MDRFGKNPSEGLSMKPFVISVVNQKGGVSKTTTTVNLGACLAEKGFRVLLIDLDSQCNLTQSLLGELEPERPCIGSCIFNESSLDPHILPTETPNLFIMPAGEELGDSDLNLTKAMAREGVLGRCLKKTNLSSYDFVLIDTAPYMSLLTMNALVASTHYIVPTLAEYLPLRGIERLTRNIERAREVLNPDLSLLGVVITQYDPRKTITVRIEEALREALGSSLFSARIRINTKFSSSPIDRKTILQFEERAGKGSEDYRQLTEEVLGRLGVVVRGEAANG